MIAGSSRPRSQASKSSAHCLVSSCAVQPVIDPVTPGIEPVVDPVSQLIQVVRGNGGTCEGYPRQREENSQLRHLGLLGSRIPCARLLQPIHTRKVPERQKE